MHVQLAEFPAEGEMLLRRDVLVAEEDHEVFGERAMDLVDLPVGPRLVVDESCDVDAGDFRADDRRQLFDGDGLIGLGFPGEMPVARALFAGQRTHGVPLGKFSISGMVRRMQRRAILAVKYLILCSNPSIELS